LGSAFGAFFAYGRMPLADVYAILFAAPLFITALSVPMLGETVGWRRWTAVVVGFIGVIVMLRPGRGLLDPGILGALAASLCFSVGSLMVRQMSRTETTASFLFHFSLTGGLLTGVMLLFDAAP